MFCPVISIFFFFCIGFTIIFLGDFQDEVEFEREMVTLKRQMKSFGYIEELYLLILIRTSHEFQ